MPIQKDYRGVPQPDLASYDWYDLVTGTGYKDFYGMDLKEGSDSSIYILSTQTLYPHDANKFFSNVAGEMNFDLDFEVPLTVEGVAIVNAPLGSKQNVGAITYTIRLYRVDEDAAEHQIGSTVTSSISLNDETKVFVAKFDIPVTRFRKGEKLRVCLINPAVGVGNGLYWFFDPKNIEPVAIGFTTFITSQLILSLPIKI